MKFYSSTLQKGSKGNEVSEWQRFLNSQGYNLAVDGDFGDKTDAATRQYQSANGLGADGIVGANTWGKAGYSNMNTPTSVPNVGNAPTRPTLSTTAAATPESKPLPNAPTYDTTSWDSTDKGKEALGGYNTAKDAVNNHGSFNYQDYTESDAVKGAGDALNAHNANKPSAYQSQWQTQLDELMGQIMNRDKFSYNMNEDAMYQQYADMYQNQAKLGMENAMGQAAAMTGGYGSSYGQQVGQQTYAQQMQGLNEVGMELYNMALDRYAREGQDLYNQYGLVADRESQDYAKYRDAVADYMNERNYLAGRYDTERGFDYGKYVDDRNMDYALHQDEYGRLIDALNIAKGDYYDGANMHYEEQSNRNNIEGQIFNDKMSLWGVENDEAWKRYQAEEEARREANALLQQGYDNAFREWEANTNNAWNQAEWDEAVRQYEKEEAWRQKEWDAKYGTQGSKPESEPEKETTDNKTVSDAGSMGDGSGVLNSSDRLDWDTVTGAESSSESSGNANYSEEKHTELTREHGGSFYNEVLGDLKDMFKNGDGLDKASAYLQDLWKNSFLTGSEIMTLLNKFRDGKL